MVAQAHLELRDLLASASQILRFKGLCYHIWQVADFYSLVTLLNQNAKSVWRQSAEKLAHVKNVYPGQMAALFLVQDPPSRHVASFEERSLQQGSTA